MILSPKQKSIWSAPQKYKGTKDTYIFDGAIRTGKSKFGMWGFIHNAICNANISKISGFTGTALQHFNSYACVAWTYGNVERNLEPYIKEYLELWGIELESNGTHGTKFKVNNIYVYLFYAGADNKKAINKVQGQTLHGAFFDEAALLQEEMIEGVIARTITFDDPLFIFCTNPEGGQEHWFYKKYIKTPRKNILRIHTELIDNPTISKKQKENFKHTYSKTMYERKVLGKWVVSEGAVYESIPDPKPIKELPKLKFITIGVDEGRVDNFTAVAIGYGYDGKYHVFREYCKKNLKYSENVNNIKVMANKIADEFNIYVDIFGETNPGILVDTLKDDRTLNKLIDVNYVKKSVKNLDWKAKGSIQERIDIVNFALKTEQILIYDTCPELISGLENAIYDKHGNRLDDGTSNIDILDGFEYGLSEELPHIWEQTKDILESEV